MLKTHDRIFIPLDAPERDGETDKRTDSIDRISLAITAVCIA